MSEMEKRLTQKKCPRIEYCVIGNQLNGSLCLDKNSCKAYLGKEVRIGFLRKLWIERAERAFEEAVEIGDYDRAEELRRDYLMRDERAREIINHEKARLIGEREEFINMTNLEIGKLERLKGVVYKNDR